MCIRDRFPGDADSAGDHPGLAGRRLRHHVHAWLHDQHADPCLLYTSDAADERSSVDLGGRRIIKKKNKR